MKYVETGVQIARMENSHGAAVNRIVNLMGSTIASGDGEGCIKCMGYSATFLLQLF
ncbi:hypothetical protein OROMI_018990 [Orobanche minor]